MFLKNEKNILVLLLGLTLMVPSSGWADEAQTMDPQSPVQINTAIQSQHIYSSDIEETGSEIDITSTNFGLGSKFKVAGQLPVEILLSIGHKDINTDSPVDLPSHLEARRLKFSAKFPAPFISDDRFFMGIDILPTFNTDSWDWQSGAFRIPFRSYLIFKESDDFILVGGVTVRPEYEREVIPLVGLIYRPNDRLSFNLASDDPNISYKLNDATLLRWELQYAFDEYEVTRGAQEGVVLQYQEIASGFGIEHQFNDAFKGLLSSGVVFNRQLKYKDDVGKVAPNAGLYVSTQLTAKF